MARGLTARQNEVADAIFFLFVRLGRLPTLRELGNATELRSVGTVWYHLRALERKGVLRPREGSQGMIAFSEIALQRLVALIPEYLGRGDDNEIPKISTGVSPEPNGPVHKEPEGGGMKTCIRQESVRPTPMRT